VVSTTVTLCCAVAELPVASVAVHVTIVVPSGNNVGVLLVIAGLGSAISVAVAVPIATACPGGVVVVASSAVISAGGVIVGEVVSTMVTLCCAVAELPVASVAVHSTIVVPSGNNAGALSVIPGFGSKLSVAVAVPIATA